MTTYYSLAIGGSGSRSVEALIYLCAAGLGPSGKLTTIFVDPDRNNYSLTHVLRVAELYHSLQALKRGADCSLFGTEIGLTKSWSPFDDRQGTPTLANYFQHGILRTTSPAGAALLEILFDRSQRDANLNIGFRGRPSIGSAVFADKINLQTEEPWRTLSQQIAAESENQHVKVFSFGSLFGGTGAAGLPTIPKILCSKIDPQTGVLAGRNANTFTGACLLLPYFSFPVARQARGEEEVFAQSEYFMLNAKEALRYYASCNPDFNRLFVLGAEDRTNQKEFCEGGELQINLPSYVELLAALSASHFYDEKDSNGVKVGVLARAKQELIDWKDVPDGGNVQAKLGQFARFSFAFLKVFHPYLQELSNLNHTWYWTLERRRAWYQDLFERRKVKLKDPDITQAIDNQVEFCRSFLIWLRDLHAGNQAKAGFRVDLADASAIMDPESPEKFIEERFGGLMKESGRRSMSIEDILRRIASINTHTISDVAGFGYFQRALYEACAYDN
jgi:hypothetical protein